MAEQPAPSQPFGALAASPLPRGHRRIRSRELIPELMTFSTIVAVAIALSVYFALH